MCRGGQEGTTGKLENTQGALNQGTTKLTHLIYYSTLNEANLKQCPNNIPLRLLGHLREGDKVEEAHEAVRQGRSPTPRRTHRQHEGGVNNSISLNPPRDVVKPTMTEKLTKQL